MSAMAQITTSLPPPCAYSRCESCDKAAGHADADQLARMADGGPVHTPATFASVPDELVLHMLCFLDVDDLLTTSRTSHRLRMLSLDPLLHKWRLRYYHQRVGHLLPGRPHIQSLQPPASTIYLTRTHLAARKLHWSLVSIRVSRGLSRRPKLSTLVSANIVPHECCRVDRTSGEFVWGAGVAGALVERKRKVEREAIKDGLRVWLERKAREIRCRRKDGGVGILAWRFSRRMKFGDGRHASPSSNAAVERPPKENVSRLRRLFEGLGNGRASAN